jgi:hypothetical protein
VIAATVIALVVLPLIALRGRTLLTYFATDAATWIFAWLLWLRLPQLSFVAVAVIKLATFSLFLATGKQVRWSVNRAALLAAIVYAVVIPRMLHAPIDGDEPYYLLVTDSIAHDFDLDLANQYRDHVGSAWGRPDLVPQFGDPRGKNGEQYSRHEPLLALLMVPGYLLAGLPGAVATIALFGVLLVRSTFRWMEDEGIADDVARAVFPLFAFAPPVLFYATRIWPEVPAAFLFVEALRGVRQQRAKRWLPALFALAMLKLRFVLVAAGVIASGRRKLALVILIVPLVVIWFLTGDATNVHTWRELIPIAPMAYVTGFCGLLLDGMSGIAFQAPFYLFAIFALTQWKKTPAGFRTGILASLLYVFYLVPRAEWFGGWAPPLRYIVFLMPVLALGIASVWDRISREAIALVSLWTVALVIHGVAYPWRLFHEFTGENLVGEWLSRLYEADFSRFFPSFIRMNDAAWWGVLGVALFLVGVRRQSRRFLIPVVSLALALVFNAAKVPAKTIHFEDAHVLASGGKLYPNEYMLMRTAYRGGRVLERGDSLSFLAQKGRHTLHFITGLGATFELAGRAYTVPANERYQSIRVTIPSAGRVTLRCLSGAVNLDRMDSANDD